MLNDIIWVMFGSEKFDEKIDEKKKINFLKL